MSGVAGAVETLRAELAAVRAEVRESAAGVEDCRRALAALAASVDELKGDAMRLQDGAGVPPSPMTPNAPASFELLRKEINADVQRKAEEILEHVRTARIHDLLRTIDQAHDERLWTNLLLAEVKAARGLHIAGFGGRPFFVKLVETLLDNKADPNACTDSGRSLLCEVLAHHHAGDAMRSTAFTATRLVAMGARLGPSELESLADAWGCGAGQEYRLQAIAAKQEDAGIRERWAAARLRFCSPEEQDGAQAGVRRPYHLSSVSLQQISELYEDHRQWIEAPAYNAFAKRETARTMHDIVKAVIKPRTAWCRGSYTDLLPAGLIDAFVSHNWSEEFPDFVRTLAAYAKATGRLLDKQPQNLRFWVCSFAICQHRVEVGNDILQTPFAQALVHCRHVVCAVDLAASLFTRAWCVYELFHSIGERKSIEFACPDGLLARSEALTGYQQGALHALASFEPENAEASKPEDRDMIFDAIRATEGGFDAVRRRIRSMVSVMYRLGEMEKDITDPISGRVLSIERDTLPLRVRVRGGEERSAAELVEEVCVGEGRRLILIAEPGSGKTVLTKQFVLHATQSEAGVATLAARVPAAELRDIFGDDLLVRWVERRCGRSSADARVFRDPGAYNFERTLLVLDGLDEAQDHLGRVLEWLTAWLQGAGRSVIVTSRPSAIPEDGEVDATLQGAGFERLDLSELALEDAQRLASLRLRESSGDVVEDISDLMAAFQGHALVRRPLLCNMLLHVMQNRLRDAPSEDPTVGLHVSEVYAEALRMMLRGVSRQGQRELCKVVAQKHAEGTRLLSYTDLPLEVAGIVKSSGLPLLEEVHGGFQVFHLSVQEFIFALAVRAGCQQLSEEHRDANVRAMLSGMVPHEAWTTLQGWDGVWRSRLACAVVESPEPCVACGDAVHFASVACHVKLFVERGCCRLSGAGELQFPTDGLSRAGKLQLEVRGEVREDVWEVTLAIAGGCRTPLSLIACAESFRGFAGQTLRTKISNTALLLLPDEVEEGHVNNEGGLSYAGTGDFAVGGDSPEDIPEEDEPFPRATGGAIQALRATVALAAACEEQSFARIVALGECERLLAQAGLCSRTATEVACAVAPGLPAELLEALGDTAPKSGEEVRIGFTAESGEDGTKYSGIALGADGRLYCAPRNSCNVLSLDPETQGFTFVGGEGEDKFKYCGIALGPDGKLYCAPRHSSRVLVVDTELQVLSFLEGAGEDENKYYGIAAGPDGRLYCAPCHSSRVLVIDPQNQSVSFIEGAGDGGDKYHSIALGPDGRLYCAPYSSSKVLVIDPTRQTVSFIEGAGHGAEKYSGIAAGPDGRLYCSPELSSRVLVIDPWRHAVSFIGDAGKGGGKCTGIALGPDGRLYCPGTRLLVIDAVHETLSFIDGEYVARYCGIARGRDGRLYCAPRTSGNVLAIDTERLGSLLVKHVGRFLLGEEAQAQNAVDAADS